MVSYSILDGLRTLIVGDRQADSTITGRDRAWADFFGRRLRGQMRVPLTNERALGPVAVDHSLAVEGPKR